MYYESELYHHGIKGQKWGVRRWQNSDGTFNEAGKKRYFADSVQTYNKAYNKANRTQEAADKAEREMKDAYKALGKNKVSRTINAIKGSRGKGGEAYERYSKAYDKANKTQEVADKAEREMKEAYKNTGKNSVSRVVNNIKYDPERMKKLASKETSKIEAVRKYNKAFNKANDLQEVADDANSEMKSAYKDLGKTKVSRVFQAFKGTIGKGNAAYERYSKAYDKAVRTQETADKAYQEMKSAYQDTGKNFVNRVYNNIKYDR